MSCGKVFSIGGCGACKYPIFDNKFISAVNPEALIRVCLHLSNNDNFSTELIVLRNSYVFCHGRVLTERKNMGEGVDLYKIFRQNVTSLGEITDEWCKADTQYSNTLVWYIMRDTSRKINSISNILSLRTYFTKLTKDIRYLTTCHGVCDKIITGKIVSNCRFKFSSKKDLAKIEDPIVILQAIAQTIYTYMDMPAKDACIDISGISIGCGGDVMLPSRYRSTRTPVGEMANMCIEILTRWCVNHKTHRDESIILDTVDKCREVDTVRTLYLVFIQTIWLIQECVSEQYN